MTRLNASVVVGSGKVGRALCGPPSGIGRRINVTLSSCGGQGTARPTNQDGRIAKCHLLLQLHFDGFGHRVDRFQIELGFDGDFLAGQILGHSP